MIQDHHPNIKLIVTGSSSFEIRKKFKDSLAGRKRVIILRKLSFDEFLRFKGENKLEKILKEISIKKICENGTVPSVLNKKFVSLLKSSCYMVVIQSQSLQKIKRKNPSVKGDLHILYRERH